MNNNFDVFEELDLDGEELEQISKKFGTLFNFPAIHIGNDVIYYNIASRSIVPKYIKWFTTHEYIIGLPTTKDDKNGYKVRADQYTTFSSFPAEIRDVKKVKPGYYKLYKYKDGFAFKRYEQCEI